MNNLSTLKNSVASGDYDEAFSRIYGGLASAQRARYITLIDSFCEEFGDMDGVRVFSAPGRTEIGGNHTDHQRGRVLAAAVSLDAIAIAAPNGERAVRIVSEGFPPEEIWLSDVMPNPAEKGTSSALIRGIIAKFADMGCVCDGFNAVIFSDITKGSGLSSSAAYEVLVSRIISSLFAENRYSPVEIARISKFAENSFFGKPCGLMDQMACAVGGAVAIDFADAENPLVENIDLDLSRWGYSLCIINTGAGHEGFADEYSAIPSEMRAVARYFGKQNLCEISADEVMENISALRKRLGDRAVMRSMHFFMETQRARLEAQALRRGSFIEFLGLVNESGRSSFMYLQNVSSCGDYENQPVGVALALCEYLLEGRGAFRVHGGGFAGTVQAFVPTDMLERFRAGMESALGADCCNVLEIRAVGALEVCT